MEEEPVNHAGIADSVLCSANSPAAVYVISCSYNQLGNGIGSSLQSALETRVLTTEALTDSESMSMFQKPFMLSNNPSCVLDRHVIGPLKKSFLPTLGALLL